MFKLYGIKHHFLIFLSDPGGHDPRKSSTVLDLVSSCRDQTSNTDADRPSSKPWEAGQLPEVHCVSKSNVLYDIF